MSVTLFIVHETLEKGTIPTQTQPDQIADESAKQIGAYSLRYRDLALNLRKEHWGSLVLIIKSKDTDQILEWLRTGIQLKLGKTCGVLAFKDTRVSPDYVHLRIDHTFVFARFVVVMSARVF